MTMAGKFENWTNEIRWHESREDKREMFLLNNLVQRELKGQVHWAGSQRKGTAIEGSDLDVCVETSLSVSKSQRLHLAQNIESLLQRQTQPRYHVIRVAPRKGSAVHLDIAFSNATFGSRPLPNIEEFESRQVRQQAARALKWWFRSGNLPSVRGWVIDGLIVSQDNEEKTSYELFMKMIQWLADFCTPAEIEFILRPRAVPGWMPEWSDPLDGQLQAIANYARRLTNNLPTHFSNGAAIEKWLKNG